MTRTQSIDYLFLKYSTHVTSVCYAHQTDQPKHRMTFGGHPDRRDGANEWPLCTAL